VAGERLHDPDDRQARAQRILDVTAQLLLRHGYRRVAVEDIARGADVGKGTVYLHWKTREELFRAVFEREVLAALDELLEALRRDADGWRPHRLARSYFLAIMGRPLLRALVLADAEVLGRLVRSDGSAKDDRHRLISRAYFELLAEHRLLPDGMDVDAVAYAFMATLEGFIRADADDRVGDDAGTHRPTPEPGARSDLLALTVRRALETERALSASDERAVAHQVLQLFTRLAVADRAEPAAVDEPQGDRP
jgi:AcrR family transcriptional regulator